MEYFKLFMPDASVLLLYPVHKYYINNDGLTADVITGSGDLFRVPFQTHNLTDAVSTITYYAVVDDFLPSYLNIGDRTQDELMEEIVVLLEKFSKDDPDIYLYNLDEIFPSVRHAWLSLKLYEYSYRNL